MIFSIINPDGSCAAVLDVPDRETAELNCEPGQTVFEGELDQLTEYLRDGVVRTYPPRPGQWAAFDLATEAWFDPRTTADLEAELQARRDGASLSKSAFLVSCMSCGLLSPAEASEAAQGLIPASFAPAVAGLNPEQRDTLAVIWPSVTQIDRTDPFILALASSLGISDETLDMVFGQIPFSP
ncbi:hypothetical protein FNJ84_17695 [Paracoccus sp. M683]|uniref:hypothetical protein n=1 Tax=Paracoccus sp. M683 TaxID=2594268 RepID=UPI00117DC2DB|nr:hypothetical protein [Paracoccus sp. M683]TRW94926.1 hypothetical protein FNJ84_17695 [Paracoccus sp. M683]